MSHFYYSQDPSQYLGLESHENAYFNPEHSVAGPSHHYSLPVQDQMQHEYSEHALPLPLPANTHPSEPQEIPHDFPRPTVPAHRRYVSGSTSGPGSSDDGHSPFGGGFDIHGSPSSVGPDSQAPYDPSFPTPQEFDEIVDDYLTALSPKKRDKALLTQKTYEDIMTVLQDPKSTDTKTAQFRFWAKKMFTLTTFGGESVICHDNKPVAVKEQIFEVLVHCHSQAAHGGRDKTSAQVSHIAFIRPLFTDTSGSQVLLLDPQRDYSTIRP
jgi:hypothetical protein